MKLTTLLEHVDELELASGRPDEVNIGSVTFDSREVDPGALFVALKGARIDGHDYLQEASDAGAAAVVVDRDQPVGALECPVLAVENTRAVLGTVGDVFCGQPSADLCVVAVTGTNGKTTTAWILEALFEAANSDGGQSTSGIIGTIGYRWAGHQQPAVNTTPESLVIQQLLAQMRSDGAERVAMEVSSHGLATHRLCGTRFDAGIFTNLTRDHLDFHGDMNAYRHAKARLFTELLPESARQGKQPVAIVNLDDPHGDWFAGRAAEHGVETATFGIETDADWRGRHIRRSLHGARFVIDGPEESFTVRSPLLGDFNVSNALAAAVAARRVGIAPDAITAGFAQLDHIPGRMQRVGAAADGPLVFVDYAHTPDALERALATTRPLTDGRLIVVFGCGGERDVDKRATMGRKAAKGADLAVVTSDNPRTEQPEAIIRQIMDGMTDQTRRSPNELCSCKHGVWVQPDRAEAIAATVEAAGADDVVVIAGKGHETYQEVAGDRLPFDDVQCVRQALGLLA